MTKTPGTETATSEDLRRRLAAAEPMGEFYRRLAEARAA